MYLLGFDVGSSSIKGALIDAESQAVLAIEKSPELEMEMISAQAGWAEQEPELWWDHICAVSKTLIHKTGIDPSLIKSIGIAYQMHGLVLVDSALKVLRPSIIWCDSRAVEIGNRAFEEIGSDKCLNHFLNSPGNFTASKLKWVRDHEPNVYEQIYKFMLPGDFIAMKLTGEINTTISGLSEGMLWDFKQNQVNEILLDHYGISKSFVPVVVDSFSDQGHLSDLAAQQTGLDAGTPVCYRAGDQPNNALSLGVYKPGQVAATGGTSGVVYGIADQLAYDQASRINSFAHVNHAATDPRVGMLLCINGAGSQYAWMSKQIAREGISYQDMEQMIESIPVGSDGLRIAPFGNGAERMLENANPGAQINNLQFNRHTSAHLYRAALEGIAFSFAYGFNMMKDFGLNLNLIKVGNDNLFQSTVFSETISNLLNVPIELIETTGAVGAAKAAGYGLGYYKNLDESFSQNKVIKIIQPIQANETYKSAYQMWENDVSKLLSN